MIYVLLAQGFEEIEAIAPVDIMRRNGLDVAIAGVDSDIVCGSHSMMISTDLNVDDIKFEDVEGIILPGGMPGTLNLKKNDKVNLLIEYCVQNELLIAAICAAPMILGELDILNGKDAVCYPGFEEHLHGASICDCPVVVSDNIITAKGAGAALEFGSAIVDYFSGESGVGDEILSQMQYNL